MLACLAALSYAAPASALMPALRSLTAAATATASATAAGGGNGNSNGSSNGQKLKAQASDVTLPPSRTASAFPAAAAALSGAVATCSEALLALRPHLLASQDQAEVQAGVSELAAACTPCAALLGSRSASALSAACAAYGCPTSQGFAQVREQVWAHSQHVGDLPRCAWLPCGPRIVVCPM